MMKFRLTQIAWQKRGTMKRTHQISALSLMGIRPADYLLSPLVWAMTLAMPAITAAGLIGASLTSLLAARFVLQERATPWVTSAALALVIASGLHQFATGLEHREEAPRGAMTR